VRIPPSTPGSAIFTSLPRLRPPAGEAAMPENAGKKSEIYPAQSTKPMRSAFSSKLPAAAEPMAEPASL
jgi:hypothetical protein